MSDQIPPPSQSLSDYLKERKDFKFEVQMDPKPKKRWFNRSTNKKKMYFKEKAILRLRNDKIDISNVTSNGPMILGLYPFRWVYAVYNSVKDYFFSRGYYTFIKAPLLEGTIKAAVNHVDTVRMHKIGEIDMNPQKKE